MNKICDDYAKIKKILIAFNPKINIGINLNCPIIFNIEKSIDNESSSRSDDAVEDFKNLKNGDQNAFSSFYYKTYKSVYYKLLSYVRDSEAANDLSQDVYIEFYKNAKNIKEDKACISFLFKIVRNIALNYNKSRKNELEYSDSILLYDKNDNDKIDVNIVFKLMLNEMMIKEDDCDILLLHIIQDYSFQEIANLTGRKINTIITRYNRTIKKLKDYLSEKGGLVYEFR